MVIHSTSTFTTTAPPARVARRTRDSEPSACGRGWSLPWLCIMDNFSICFKLFGIKLYLSNEYTILIDYYHHSSLPFLNYGSITVIDNHWSFQLLTQQHSNLRLRRGTVSDKLSKKSLKMAPKLSPPASYLRCCQTPVDAWGMSWHILYLWHLMYVYNDI